MHQPATRAQALTARKSCPLLPHSLLWISGVLLYAASHAHGFVTPLTSTHIAHRHPPTRVTTALQSVRERAVVPGIPPSDKDHSSAAFDEVASPAERGFQDIFGKGDKRPVVLFDGVCGFCNAAVDTLLRIDTRHKLRFAPLQSPVGQNLMEACGRSPDDISSVVVVEASRKLTTKSDAAIRITEIAPAEPASLGWSLLRGMTHLTPRGLRDSAYDVLANNRYNVLGKRDECRLPDPDDDRWLLW